MNWDVADGPAKNETRLWQELPDHVREALTGKLSGLWDAISDEVAFNNFPVGKQQALLIFVARLGEKGLWQVIRKINNVYGEGGVGIGFSAWPLIVSTLERRKDFTRFMANHKGTGGFYERGRPDAILHFVYEDGPPQKWYVHFDLYSPVHSLVSAFKHLRFEFFGKITPDWRIIRQRLHCESR